MRSHKEVIERAVPAILPLALLSSSLALLTCAKPKSGDLLRFQPRDGGGVDLEAATVGSTAAVPFAAANSDNQVINMFMAGRQSEEFSLAAPLPLALRGEMLIFHFTPQGAGPRTATLYYGLDNGLDGGVALSGTGVSPAARSVP